MYSSKKILYWKRVGQRELLEKILEFLDSQKNNASIDDLKQRLGKILVEIEEELRYYTGEIDPIYHVLKKETASI